jgi:hypothetical protein
VKYFGVIGNRDHIKYQGERLPFWYFLDAHPDGWLCSLAYQRSDVPTDRQRLWDCGAWSYKREQAPKLGKHLVTPAWALEQYQALAQPGDFVIAPDHMLLPGTDLDARRRFNHDSAEQFFALVAGTGLTPMACIHGADLGERIQHAQWLCSLGYEALALGGLAGQASKRAMALAAVAAVRGAVPDAWLHVLGLSAPSYVSEWHLLGVDSCDGASHFKQAFTCGRFFTEQGGSMIAHQAARPGELVTAPLCDCLACQMLRQDGIDTRRYGSNETNMGRAAHNLNMLMRAHAHVRGGPMESSTVPTTVQLSLLEE